MKIQSSLILRMPLENIQEYLEKQLDLSELQVDKSLIYSMDTILEAAKEAQNQQQQRRIPAAEEEMP